MSAFVSWKSPAAVMHQQRLASALDIDVVEPPVTNSLPTEAGPASIAGSPEITDCGVTTTL
jgi:hypothetical protein